MLLAQPEICFSRFLPFYMWDDRPNKRKGGLHMKANQSSPRLMADGRSGLHNRGVAT